MIFFLIRVAVFLSDFRFFFSSATPCANFDPNIRGEWEVVCTRQKFECSDTENSISGKAECAREIDGETAIFFLGRGFMVGSFPSPHPPVAAISSGRGIYVV